MWATGGTFFGSVAGLAIGAVQGSLKRDELKKSIPEAVEARKKVFIQYSYNQYLVDNLKYIKNTLDALTGVGFDEKIILDILTKQVENIQKEAESMTDTFLEKLKAIDSARNSWTKED